jgi:hypothetical protein
MEKSVFAAASLSIRGRAGVLPLRARLARDLIGLAEHFGSAT